MYSEAKQSLTIGRLLILTPAVVFMISTMIVNGGNYLYNILLGRVLSPADFSEAALLITFLLVFSFIAMTFQIVTTKFSVQFENEQLLAFKHWITQLSLYSGMMIGIGLALFSQEISAFFHLSSPVMLLIFASTVPIYFLLSTKRGLLQGAEKFVHLSTSYQVEVWGRFIITFLLLLTIRSHPATLVSIAIAGSIWMGNLSISKVLPRKHLFEIPVFKEKKMILHFFLLTMGYECAQILINYSDLLLVKHYFEPHIAGLYTSMALIGRMIYFMTWMLVMVMIPKVLHMKKDGKPYKKLFITYFLSILGISVSLVIVAFSFPNQIVTLLFGASYLDVAHLLWQYGLATMLFALANLFVYYFLCLDRKTPVVLAVVAGLVQLTALIQFHESLSQMIWVQVIIMSTLLSSMFIFFIKYRNQ